MRQSILTKAEIRFEEIKARIDASPDTTPEQHALIDKCEQEMASIRRRLDSIEEEYIAFLEVMAKDL